jgi:hypothetical protein
MIGENSCCRAREKSQQKILNIITDESFPAAAVDMHSFRWVCYNLFQNLQAAGLDKPSDSN